jgi:2-methylisocitrate lyase-like PEP mutase family enzyme
MRTFSGQTAVDMNEMLAKFEAACAARTDPNFVIVLRTDARTVAGLEEAVFRGRAFAEAGADAVFVESPMSLDELKSMPERIPDVPLIVNIVEGGLTPELSVRELDALGYAVVIHANFVMRVMAKAAADALSHLKAHGETKSLAESMLSWDQRQSLVDRADYAELENAFYARAQGLLTRQLPPESESSATGDDLSASGALRSRKGRS